MSDWWRGFTNWRYWLAGAITGAIVGLTLVLLAACTHGGPVGHTLTCTDTPSDAPVASRCD